MIKITIELNEEQIREAFENAEVRFSKAKLKTLKDEIEFQDIDIKELLENALQERLEEMIADEWEK
jgi:ribosomal protein L12E/L44/L45/RPP1/RPP2